MKTTKIRKDLLPCPVCGWEILTEVRLTDDLGQRLPEYWIQCQLCGCRLESRTTLEDAEIFWSWKPGVKNCRKVEAMDTKNKEEGLINYPFPIRDYLCAFLKLPKDLTLIEVERLHQFMMTVVKEAWVLRTN